MAGSLNLFILLLFFPLIMSGQKQNRSDKLLDNARHAYEKGDLSKAIDIAGRITVNDPSHIGAHLFLADLYDDLDSIGPEIFHIKKAVAIDSSMSLLFYRLGTACFRNGDYRESLKSLDKYLNMSPSGSLAQKAIHLKMSCEFAAEAIKHPVVFDPVSLGDSINSINDEYWPSLTVDNQTLVFTRLLPVYKRPELKQEDFYSSHNDSSGWSLALPLTELNTPMNEGAQSISADGRLLFFTLCNHPDGFGSCDIYFSRFENGRWTKPLNAGRSLNTAGWEGQPSLSASGNQLFFSSDRPGGKGKKDIWSAILKDWRPDGIPVWGEITNPGDSINSPGDEISPFIHSNGRDLYFCSDYRPGFGGYDIYHSTNKGASGWSEAKNLGFPVNSPGNEQGLVIDRTGATAYFSSNRHKAGNMDIYSFDVDEKLRPAAVTYMRGKVVSKTTRLPLSSEVRLSYTEQETMRNTVVQSGMDGVFTQVLPENINLSFSVEKEGYLFYSERFQLTGPSSAISPVERIIELTPAEPGSSLNLYHVYFETDAFAILPESEPELEILTEFLRKNPSLSVEIQGHTDNVGTAVYNQKLSERRAGSVVEYLIAKGISSVRLSARGYGLEKPVAGNDTEEGRSKNRRTTMKIVE